MLKPKHLNIALKQAFIQLIAKQTGLEVRKLDQATLDEKIFFRIKALKLSSPEQYYQLLESTPLDSSKEWQNLIGLLTNNESYFFRDIEQLNLLKTKIFPEIYLVLVHHLRFR